MWERIKEYREFKITKKEFDSPRKIPDKQETGSRKPGSTKKEKKLREEKKEWKRQRNREKRETKRGKGDLISKSVLKRKKQRGWKRWVFFDSN